MVKKGSQAVLYLIRPPLESDEERTGIGGCSDSISEFAARNDIPVKNIILKTRYDGFMDYLKFAMLYPAVHSIRCDNRDSVFHAMDDYGGIAFPFIRGRKVVTIHHVLRPDEFQSRFRYIIYNVISTVSILFSDRILAISNQTKAEILRKYNIRQDKISVIGNRISDEFRNDGSILPERMFCYVGALITRKNFIAALRVFRDVQSRSGFEDCRFIICGTGPEEARIRSTISEMGLSDSVDMVCNLTSSQLNDLYNRSVAMINTTSHEGFGLPIIEAQKCGTPVLCFRDADIPEEVTEAAVLCTDEKDMADYAVRMLSDPVFRSTCSSAGMRVAERFNKNFDTDMLKLYELH